MTYLRTGVGKRQDEPGACVAPESLRSKLKKKKLKK